MADVEGVVECPECGKELEPHLTRAHAIRHWGEDLNKLSEEGFARYKQLWDAYVEKAPEKDEAEDRSLVKGRTL